MKGNKSQARHAGNRQWKDDRADLSAVVPVRVPAAAGLSPASDLSNVVPFVAKRPGKAGRKAPAVVADPALRAIRAIRSDRRATLAALVVGSVLLHGAFLAIFDREPAPVASIGLVAINVELTLGANTPAGQSPRPSESEFSSAAAPKELKPLAPAPEAARSAPKPVPPQPVQQTTPSERNDVAAAPPVDPDAEQSMPKAMEPAEAKPRDEDKPVVEPRKPVPEKTKAREDAKNARNRAAPASAPSAASNSVGRGRSDADTNYRGLVAAHLARYKQFPADARSRGDQGTSVVSFGLDGGGRVTSVRLVRGSGHASLDQETQAMVRRASPFPAPPSGRPQSFTVPINFALR